MRRFSLFIFSLFIFTSLTYAQRMSDDQAVQYVKQAQAAGKSQKQMTTELLRRGVTQEQVLRIKAQYEATNSTSDGTDNKPTQMRKRGVAMGESYEAAEIDGANTFQKFTKITLPLVKPTMMFVLIISMINSFQAFDQIYVMTNGGPGKATQVVCYLIYQNAFNYFKQGYASAMAYVLFVIIFIASIIQLKFSEKNNL